jgi:anaerobic magnesium-protoporphyrin IX monomethyl ester cyclase
MKVLLLNPPMNYGAYNQAGRVYLDKSYPPLGLAYIAAILKKNGFNVKLFDLIDVEFDEAKKLIEKEKPDVIGISCNLTDYRWGSFRIAELAKQTSRNVTVVLGGSHVTHLYEQVLTNFSVDIVVLFEGELTFLELVKALEARNNLQSVKGIAFKLGDKIIRTESRSPIEDLDALPFPIHSAFEFDRYVHYSAPARFKGETVARLRSSNIMASRGCVHNCIYCSIAKFWPRKCRQRSPKNVVDEMEMLHTTLGVTHFNFFDDLFTQNKDRVIEICKEILNRKILVCWECVTRVDSVSEDILSWMKKAGCVSISYGVESGSNLVLGAMKKGQSRAQIAKAFRMTQLANIKAYMLIMIGNPLESDETINQTVELIRAVKPDKLRTTLTVVYPATDLYEMSKEKGCITDSYWLSKYAAPVFTVENSVKKLQKWERKVAFAYSLEQKRIFAIYEILFYRILFSNLREIVKSLLPKSNRFMDKIDHILHSG